jgi:hypothetical protein
MTVKFAVRFLPTTSVKPYHQNVKTHSRRNVAAIAELLARFDFDQPIVVDADFVIIKGHGRYMAAVYSNLKMVPVIIRDDLTPEQCQVARIADNRVFELGLIDHEGVRAELEDFVKEGGEGAEVIFDFLKPAKEKPAPGDSGLQVSVSGVTKGPSLEGTMLICPKCDFTFWEQKP